MKPNMHIFQLLGNKQWLMKYAIVSEMELKCRRNSEKQLTASATVIQWKARKKSSFCEGTQSWFQYVISLNVALLSHESELSSDLLDEFFFPKTKPTEYRNHHNHIRKEDFKKKFNGKKERRWDTNQSSYEEVEV